MPTIGIDFARQERGKTAKILETMRSGLAKANQRRGWTSSAMRTRQTSAKKQRSNERTGVIYSGSTKAEMNMNKERMNKREDERKEEVSSKGQQFQ